MDARAKFLEVASKWTQSREKVGEETSAEVLRAWHDAEAALNLLGGALWRDAQVRTSSAVSGMKRRVSDAELELELLLSRMPGVGPRVAMGLHSRTHPASEAEAWATRPSNELDPEDVALLQGNSETGDYLDAIGMHVA